MTAPTSQRSGTAPSGLTGLESDVMRPVLLFGRGAVIEGDQGRNRRWNTIVEQVFYRMQEGVFLMPATAAESALEHVSYAGGGS